MAVPLKGEMVRVKGETMIVVPCWWDGSAESLVASIKFSRPDLRSVLPSPSATPSSPPPNPDAIPLNPAPGFLERGVVPDVGELMLASFPSNTFEQTVAKSHPWWLGEKYDGIRVCWNSNRNKLFTRTGVEIFLPQKFSNVMAPVFLDGEIWFGRGCYLDSQRLLQQFDLDALWQSFRIAAFDCANTEMNELPFENPTNNFKYADFDAGEIVCGRILCTSSKLMIAASHQIIDDQGEGIILRKPDSLYEHGRNSSLLKLKASRADMEALVVQVSDSQLTLQLPDSSVFDVDRDEEGLGATVQRGDVVSFSYERYSRHAIPTAPSLFRIRHDLTWQDILHDFASYSSHPQALNEHSQKVVGFTNQPAGYWKSEKGKNMRTFLERFAKSRNFDPLMAENWYHLPRSDLAEMKGASTVLANYSGSLVAALIDLFPEVVFDESQFTFVRKNYWNIGNRRKLLEDFAQRQGFDPLIPENWYSISADQIHSIKGAPSILQYYNGNAVTAIVHLFPELDLDEYQFISLRRDHWLDPINQRGIFEAFAKRHAYEPLTPSFWYKLSRERVTFLKRNYPAIFELYNGSYVRAVVALFPELSLDFSQFEILQYNYWKDPTNRKRFLDRFAKMKKFDPGKAENWYNIKREEIIQQKGGIAMLSHYKRLADAVIDMYPDVAFDKHRFLSSPYNRIKPIKRANLFYNFAKQKGFDPLIASNWYNISRAEILAIKGASSLLRNFNGSVSKAIMSVFPNIGLKELKFSVLPHNFWRGEVNRRNFFINYSQEKRFDALIASNWYNVPILEFIKAKGASTVLRYHQGNFVDALMVLFPDVSFDERCFQEQSKKVPIGKLNV